MSHVEQFQKRRLVKNNKKVEEKKLCEKCKSSMKVDGVLHCKLRMKNESEASVFSMVWYMKECAWFKEKTDG